MCYSLPDRERAHRWTLERWRRSYAGRPGWNLAFALDRARTSEEEGPRTTDTFNHPKAINAAVAGVGTGAGDDVLVIADADTFPEPGSLVERVQAAYEGRWSAPSRYVNLSELTTGRILRDATTFEDATEIALAATDHVWQGGTSWSGVVVIRRDQFEDVGGYDETYDGWWADDVAFAMAVETLVRPVERIGPVFHLWHDAPRSHTYERAGFSETWVRTSLYLDARGDPVAMRKLVDEREAAA
jgi:hypothetical protein